MMKIFKQYDGFQWDEGNIDKNFIEHNVSHTECEQVFFNLPLIVAEDVKHSIEEQRNYLLGKTESGRCLFISFTVRKNLIRVISASDMNKKERNVYEQRIKKDTEIQG